MPKSGSDHQKVSITQALSVSRETTALCAYV